MALVGSSTAGHPGDPGMNEPLQGSRKAALGPGQGTMGRKLKGDSSLFGKKHSGSGGKLGKTSQLSAGLSRLRGKGALA